MIYTTSDTFASFYNEKLQPIQPFLFVKLKAIFTTHIGLFLGILQFILLYILVPFSSRSPKLPLIQITILPDNVSKGPKERSENG